MLTLRREQKLYSRTETASLQTGPDASILYGIVGDQPISSV